MRRVAMCASHIIDEIVTARLACVSIAAAFRDAMAFFVCQRKGALTLAAIAARRTTPDRLVVVGERT
jgi:hypothetical protein